jgi:vancomycin resistance protein YoaR
MRLENPSSSSGTRRHREEDPPSRDRSGKDRESRASGRARRRITGPAVVVCAVVAVLVALDYWSNAGKVYRGVEVGGVALGGKTPGEAREALEERASGALGKIEFTGPEDFAVTAEELGVEVDVAATVERAYAVGRRGSVPERLVERAHSAFVGVSVPARVGYRTDIARATVENLAARVNREPQEASVAVSGSEVEVAGSREGYRLDVPATMENLDRAVKGITGEVKVVGEMLEPKVDTEEAEEAAEKARKAVSGGLMFEAEGESWTLSPADVGSSLDVMREDGELRVSLGRDRLKERLANVYADLTVEPVEAGYDVNSGTVTVTPSREGQRIEEEKLLSAIEGGLFEGKREYQVPVVTDKPELTTAEAERLKPTELLASYRTNYTLSSDRSEERVENLQISSGAIDGTVLAPGEVFSMNDTVSGLDYNATKVIVNDQETLADGGGLCQVTSTLYMAANYAGLDVIERHAHSAQLPYIRPGLDATIWFGDGTEAGELDMEFRNTTGGYVFLREYVADDGYVYAEVWGRPNGVEVEMWSEPVYRNVDSAKWVTYQRYEKDGEVLYNGVLHKDTYGALTDEKGKPIPADSVPIAPVNP